jgi:RNA polymerase-binding transcription factor DksA
MTSHRKELPPGPGEPDVILMALFQSRLRERSLYLGEEIRRQRSRLSAHAQRARHDDGADEPRAALARIQRAEQALEAVQQAQERLGRGRYGVCDECQSTIDWDELLEAPEQTLCRACSPFGAFDSLRLGS